MAKMYSQKYENALNERGGVRHDLICSIAVVRPYTLAYSVSVELVHCVAAKAVA